MQQLKLLANSGLCFEWWLKKRTNPTNDQPLLIIQAGEKIVYKIVDAPHYHEFFSYKYYDDCPLTLTLSEDAEISLGYIYHPHTVYQQGVTYLDLQNKRFSLITQKDMGTWYRGEEFRPQQHFSPFKAWMNDPNGLCKIGDFYHLFYQFHPNGTEWGPMHWGHAISRDLIQWTHLPVFNFPQQNLSALGATGGAFSGSAYLDELGKPTFFYTERLPAYDLYKDYIEIQRKCELDKAGIKASALRTIIEEKVPGVGCDIRDPKVWFDKKTHIYRMILGSVFDGHPAVLQYTSQDSEHWTFANVLYQAPSYFSEHQGRCVECPDFFPLGDKWVLIIGIVGYKEPATGRFNLLYAITGQFDSGEFYPDNQELQVLDFATEYYALQTFSDGNRQIGIAWLFNWAMKKPISSEYNGEMSIPKVFHLNADNQVCMKPVTELDNYISSSTLLNIQGKYTHPVDNSKTFRLRLVPRTENPFTVKIYGDEDHWIALNFDGQHVSVIENQPANACYASTVHYIDDIELLFDAGILEIFINDGVICATKRNYQIPTCRYLDFSFSGQEDISVTLDTLRTSWSKQE